MNIFDRIILAIYMLFMALIALCIIGIPFNLIPRDIIGMIIDQLYSRWYYSLAGAILFLVSLKLLISGVRSNNRAKKGIVKQAEHGSIRISIETFETMSLRVIKQIAGIKDVKVVVGISEGELIIITKLLVLPDVSLQQVISEVQGRIKSYVENMSEVNVKEVRVAIDNIASVATTRVE
jgi:uncharacterized alkaline shock family protein YloU